MLKLGIILLSYCLATGQLQAYAHHEALLALMSDDRLYDVMPPRVDAALVQGLDSTMTGTLSR